MDESKSVVPSWVLGLPLWVLGLLPWVWFRRGGSWIHCCGHGVCHHRFGVHCHGMGFIVAVTAIEWGSSLRSLPRGWGWASGRVVKMKNMVRGCGCDPLGGGGGERTLGVFVL